VIAKVCEFRDGVAGPIISACERQQDWIGNILWRTRTWIRLKAFDHRLIDKSAREMSIYRERSPERPSRVPSRCHQMERFAVVDPPHGTRYARDPVDIRTPQELMGHLPEPRRKRPWMPS